MQVTTFSADEGLDSLLTHIDSSSLDEPIEKNGDSLGFHIVDSKEEYSHEQEDEENFNSHPYPYPPSFFEHDSLSFEEEKSLLEKIIELKEKSEILLAIKCKTPSEEDQLTKIQHERNAYIGELASKNLLLARKYAHRYNTNGREHDLDDLTSEALFKLIEIIDVFDYSKNKGVDGKGGRLSTFFHYAVRNHLKGYIDKEMKQRWPTLSAHLDDDSNTLAHFIQDTREGNMPEYVENKLFFEQVYAEIDNCPSFRKPKTRDILKRMLCGEDPELIAQDYSTSKECIKSQYFESRKRLFTYLKEKNFNLF